MSTYFCKSTVFGFRGYLIPVNSIVPPLLIIFNNALATGTFPNTWKKANVVPIHKKREKISYKSLEKLYLR